VGGAAAREPDYIRALSGDVLDNSAGPYTTESAVGYGYQVWRCTVPGAYRADGLYGQFSIVFPDRRAVVTITSHRELEQNDILRAVWRDILPCL